MNCHSSAILGWVTGIIQDWRHGLGGDQMFVALSVFLPPVTYWHIHKHIQTDRWVMPPPWSPCLTGPCVLFLSATLPHPLITQCSVSPQEEKCSRTVRMHRVRVVEEFRQKSFNLHSYTFFASCTCMRTTTLMVTCEDMLQRQGKIASICGNNPGFKNDRIKK